MLFITYNQLTDALACAVKSGIEQTDLRPFSKEILKFIVDGFADYLKRNFGITIIDIQKAAVMTGVQSVVGIPYHLASGEKGILLCVHGGNSAQFFARLGLTPIAQQNYSYYNELIQHENNCGIIIYNQI